MTKIFDLRLELSRSQDDALLRVVIPWRIVPAKRTNRRDFSPQAKAYHSDQKRIASFLQSVPFAAQKPFGGIVRLGTAVFVGPCKSGPRKGLMPGNIGDWDNYQKAIADCLVYHGWLIGDSAPTMRGPDLVLVPETWDFGELVESGIYTIAPETVGFPPTGATVITLWATNR